MFIGIGENRCMGLKAASDKGLILDLRPILSQIPTATHIPLFLASQVAVQKFPFIRFSRYLKEYWGETFPCTFIT